MLRDTAAGFTYAQNNDILIEQIGSANAVEAMLTEGVTTSSIHILQSGNSNYASVYKPNPTYTYHYLTIDNHEVFIDQVGIKTFNYRWGIYQPLKIGSNWHPPGGEYEFSNM